LEAKRRSFHHSNAPFFTDFCTFSKADTPIWRTRSRETPNSAASSLSVIGSSASRRASNPGAGD
jgi:hypothetical protein